MAITIDWTKDSPKNTHEDAGPAVYYPTLRDIESKPHRKPEPGEPGMENWGFEAEKPATSVFKGGK